MGLYIEARIRADLDDLWTRTQEPSQHQRWDLRFTRITYLPRADGEPQRFRYATRVLPGLTVAGTGVSAGERERPDGTRTSALRFSSRTRSRFSRRAAATGATSPTATASPSSPDTTTARAGAASAPWPTACSSAP